MARIRLSKQFSFEMAHSLWNYTGMCRNIHGHSYKLDVTVIGEPNNNKDDPNQGMVMDFKELKRIVNKNIISKLDHAYILNSQANYKPLMKLKDMFDRHEIVDYQPTCEMLLLDFAERIKNELPSNVKLYSLKLRETDRSYAEWYASDNVQD